MKKQILTVSFALLSVGLFAQKKELRELEKAIDKNRVAEAKTLLAPLEANEDAIEDKYKAQYYYLKGATYGRTNVEKAAEAYNKLFEIEKAERSDKYTKEAQPKLNDLIQYVSNLAIKQYNEDKQFEQIIFT